MQGIVIFRFSLKANRSPSKVRLVLRVQRVDATLSLIKRDVAAYSKEYFYEAVVPVYLAEFI